MRHPRIACLLFILFTAAVTVSADIIPPYGGGRNHPYPERFQGDPPSIDLTAKNVPKGLVLILLDNDNAILQKAHSGEMIRIAWESTLYLAVADKLSDPFNYDKDKKNLFKLRHYQLTDLPPYVGRHTVPIEIECTVQTVGAQNYILKCR
jgi:hypothetical protein